MPLTACITRETALASAKTSGGASSSVPKTLSDTYSAARSDEDVIAYFLLRERALVLGFVLQHTVFFSVSLSLSIFLQSYLLYLARLT